MVCIVAGSDFEEQKRTRVGEVSSYDTTYRSIEYLTRSENCDCDMEGTPV